MLTERFPCLTVWYDFRYFFPAAFEIIDKSRPYIRFLVLAICIRLAMFSTEIFTCLTALSVQFRAYLLIDAIISPFKIAALTFQAIKSGVFFFFLFFFGVKVTACWAQNRTSWGQYYSTRFLNGKELPALTIFPLHQVKHITQTCTKEKCCNFRNIFL